MSIDEAVLRAQIAAGSQNDLWQLAGTRGLPEWAYQAILERGDEIVLSSLAMNYECPPSILATIAARGGEIATFARRNPNASPETKDPSPLGAQSARSVDVYLTARNATPEQRVRFAALHRISPVDGGPSVGEAWLQIDEEMAGRDGTE